MDLYSPKDDVPPVDPSLEIIHRSKAQAVKWARSEANFAQYIQNVTAGKQYADYPFES